MNRRTFLAAVAATSTASGCLSALNGSGDAPSETGSSPPSTSPEDRSTPTGSRTPLEDTPVATFAVGERSGDVGPLGVTVENDGADPRTVSLRITAVDRNETVLDRNVSLAPDDRIEGTVKTPATYEISLAVPEIDRSEVTTVDRGTFDVCNSYGYTATIEPDGRIRARVFTTLVKCLTATASGNESLIVTASGNESADE